MSKPSKLCHACRQPLDYEIAECPICRAPQVAPPAPGYQQAGNQPGFYASHQPSPYQPPPHQQLPPQGYQQHPAYANAGSKKITAGICALLLGGFGVHKFILGYPGAGIIMILLTFLTCGLTGIISLIEGIIYLTKSDEDFYHTYIARRREWF